MKRIIAIIAALAGFAACADARIITYNWHQTGSSDPNLVFDAWYQVSQGSAPLPANSNQRPPNFGGLVGLYIQGGSYPSITLSDLVPSCDDGSGCSIGGNFHDFGSPYWTIDVPDFFYLAATELQGDPFHREWEYWATSTSILIGDDNAYKRCWDTSLCTATGYWQPDYAPEPATLFAFAGGMLGFLLIRRRRRRIA